MQRPAETDKAFREELERLLASDALRSSDSLRRLLSYLAEAHLAGAGRGLKEYAIGRDVMSKPADYDPRVDASVRVQIGKLRQRLEQYYRSEAPGAAWEIRLPKGHFEIVFDESTQTPAPPVVVPQSAAGMSVWRGTAAALAAVCVVLAGALAWAWQTRDDNRTRRPAWPSELREFWAPYVDSQRPVMVVLGSPLFVRFHNHYFRNPWANSWDEVEKAVPLKEMERLLGAPTPATETHRWTPFGEAMAAFRLATLISPEKDDVFLKRSTVLAWEDIRANNMIFLGPPKFNPQLHDLPVEQDFVIENGGVTNRRPGVGELARYKRTSPPEVEEIPDDYVVITRVRGVEGWGEILVLACTSTEGTWAAADYVTRGSNIKHLLSRLKSGNGGVLPESYQVLLKANFKAQVPIGVDYVTHHVLRRKGL